MTWFTQEQILALMEALADADATVSVRCWRTADGFAQQVRGKRGDWTGPYRYEMLARFAGSMTAEDCARLAAIVREHGAEAILWEHDEERGMFHIHPPGDLQFDEKRGK